MIEFNFGDIRKKKATFTILKFEHSRIISKIKYNF